MHRDEQPHSPPCGDGRLRPPCETLQLLVQLKGERARTSADLLAEVEAEGALEAPRKATPTPLSEVAPPSLG